MNSPSGPGRLNILVLSDGRPGHYNTSKGVLRVLEKEYPVDHEWLEIRLRSGVLRRPLHWMICLIKGSWPLGLIKVFYILPDLPEKPPDIILSAGGKTSYLNIILARNYNARNIYLSSLREHSADNFSAIITIEPVPDTENNIVVEMAPSMIDPAEINDAGAEYRKAMAPCEGKLWSMIIGGDGSGYRYQAADWKSLAENMKYLSDHYGVKWLLTTSGRTGTKNEELLMSQIAPDILSDAVWFSDNPRKAMKSFLGASEVVFCTEDSMTMLTESVLSDRPVISLRPESSKPNERYNNQLARLELKQWLRRVAINQMQTQVLDNFPVINESIATRLDAYLLSQLRKYIAPISRQ